MGFLHIVEFIIIIGVIVLQIRIAFKLDNKINILGGLKLSASKIKEVVVPDFQLKELKYTDILKCFDADPNIAESYASKAYRLLQFSNEVHNKRIEEDINTYLLKNTEGMTDFNILRDIVDRNIEVLDEDINQLLPAPLYMGLSATMVGIIMGLIAMISSGAEIAADISSLILGVGIAMGASLVGVGLTTIFSTRFYKNAKREMEEDKNLLFSSMQADLLPQLHESESSGLELLNRRINEFGNLNAESVDCLSSITSKNTAALKSQQKLVKKVNQLESIQISYGQRRVFELLNDNMGHFDAFRGNWEKLHTNIRSISTLADSLKDIVNQTHNIENIAGIIISTIEEYRNGMAFFTEHINVLEKEGHSMRNMISSSEVQFKEVMKLWVEEQQARISSVEKHSSLYDSNFDLIREHIITSLEMVVKKHLTEINQAYQDYIPEFSQLKHLPLLLDISKGIDQQSEKLFKIKSDKDQQNDLKIDQMEKQLSDITKEVEMQQKEIDLKQKNHLEYSSHE